MTFSSKKKETQILLNIIIIAIQNMSIKIVNISNISKLTLQLRIVHKITISSHIIIQYYKIKFNAKFD